MKKKNNEAVVYPVRIGSLGLPILDKQPSSDDLVSVKMHYAVDRLPGGVEPMSDKDIEEFNRISRDATPLPVNVNAKLTEDITKDVKEIIELIGCGPKIYDVEYADVKSAFDIMPTNDDDIIYTPKLNSTKRNYAKSFPRIIFVPDDANPTPTSLNEAIELMNFGKGRKEECEIPPDLKITFKHLRMLSVITKINTTMVMLKYQTLSLIRYGTTLKHLTLSTVFLRELEKMQRKASKKRNT